MVFDDQLKQQLFGLNPSGQGKHNVRVNQLALVVVAKVPALAVITPLL
jgi:hypothetical protein